MPPETPMKNPEMNKGISDNDRKFIVEDISSEFLVTHAKDMYDMDTYWIETNNDNEAKLVEKTRNNTEKEFLYIAKVGVEQDRKSEKTKLTQQQYTEQLDTIDPSKPHVKKRRYEFELTQNGIEFVAKYDVFAGSTLRVLEIDAKSKTDEDRNAFDPHAFGFAIVEVTGITQFYGHRIANLVHYPMNQ